MTIAGTFVAPTLLYWQFWSRLKALSRSEVPRKIPKTIGSIGRGLTVSESLIRSSYEQSLPICENVKFVLGLAIVDEQCQKIGRGMQRYNEVNFNFLPFP